MIRGRHLKRAIKIARARHLQPARTEWVRHALARLARSKKMQCRRECLHDGVMSHG